MRSTSKLCKKSAIRVLQSSDQGSIRTVAVRAVFLEIEGTV